MAGVYNGAQALARQEQPLALFVHCISHCVNLATEAAMTESNVIRDAVCLVNEVGVLSSQSGKFQTIFSRAASSMYDTVVRLRPSSVSDKVNCESQGDQECTAAVRICVAGPGRNVEIQGRICSKSRRDVTKILARKYVPN